VGYAGIDSAVVMIANTFMRMCNCERDILIVGGPDFGEAETELKKMRYAWNCQEGWLFMH
jgi:hypothetical protein